MLGGVRKRMRQQIHRRGGRRKQEFVTIKNSTVCVPYSFLSSDRSRRRTWSSANQTLLPQTLTLSPSTQFIQSPPPLWDLKQPLTNFNSATEIQLSPGWKLHLSYHDRKSSQKMRRRPPDFRRPARRRLSNAFWWTLCFVAVLLFVFILSRGSQIESRPAITRVKICFPFYIPPNFGFVAGANSGMRFN